MTEYGHLGMSESKAGKFAITIGIVSSVAGSILVAWEIHQANNLAKAQMVMDPAAQAGAERRPGLRTFDEALDLGGRAF